MTADYTKVALRSDERWEGAPTQQGRALLDHELNLNVHASVRRDRHLAADAIGPAGVVAGSTAFQVSVTPAGALDLTIDDGRMWVEGHEAFAPLPFTYLAQDQIDALPAGGPALVYLDVWDEHLQPAEDLELIDPALGAVDTAARTRVGYRVRVAPTTASTCAAAWAGFAPGGLSTGRANVSRVGPPVAPDPCAPPGDPRGLLPDGLLRIEVFDSGSASSARFAWSYENGSAAVAIAGIAGNTVTLHPSASTKFDAGLVEISWLARRADRTNAGSLYTIQSVAASPGGDVLTLDRPVLAPAGAVGLVARRWDGEVIGATAAQNLSRDGVDLGVRLDVTAGNYRAGDWWGVRVRESVGVEQLVNAAPDGTPHVFAPLALVDLTARTVVDDCRPTFQPLTEIESGSACTVIVRPLESIQTAVDALPPGGGEVCIAAGDYPLTAPVLVKNRNRVRIVGVGPATVVRSLSGEVVFQFVDSDEVEVADLSVSATPADKGVAGDGLGGALSFAGCRGVSVRSVHVTVPDGPTRAQTAITVAANGNRLPERVAVADNHLVVGSWQVGILVTDGRDVAIERNHVSLLPRVTDRRLLVTGPGLFIDELTRLFGASTRQPAPGGRPIRLPTGRNVSLPERSPVLPVIEEWSRTAPVSNLSDRAAFRRFTLAALDDTDNTVTLAPPARSALVNLFGSLRSVGQGIVIGGTRASTIRIVDNVVRDAIQGVHVGVSARGTSRVSTDDVLVSRNSIHLRVPTTYSRERHAVYVGNAGSAMVLDTQATVERSISLAGVVRTAVDAIHIVGTFGPTVLVRGASVSGFEVGVRALPLGSVPTQRLWSISEVMAAGVPGAHGVIAPATFARSLVAPP